MQSLKVTANITTKFQSAFWGALHGAQGIAPDKGRSGKLLLTHLVTFSVCCAKVASPEGFLFCLVGHGFPLHGVLQVIHTVTQAAL